MNFNENEKNRHKEDICSHLGDDYNSHLGAIVPPIFQSSLFTRKTKNHGYTYTRVSNPTLEVAEVKIAALEEGSHALTFSSGMAAITAGIMHFVEKDCHIISVKSLYSPARTFIETYLQKMGVESTFVIGDSIEQFEQAIKPHTKLIYLESPVSNVFTMQNLQQIADLARSKGIATMIDNTWATPLFQNPLTYGIDVVVHSASKYLGGHSDIIGGVLVGTEEVTTSIIHNERGLYGAIMDPHQAWLLTRGLRTLPLRMAQHASSGMTVAKFLQDHPMVEQVYYPGLEEHPQYALGQKQMSGYNGLLSFVPKNPTQSLSKMADVMSLFEVGPSWGGFESLMNFPGEWVTEEISEVTGLPQGLIRLSVGLENISSILEDIDRGLHYLTRGIQ